VLRDPDPLLAWVAAGGSAFGLAFLAEMADKTQIAVDGMASTQTPLPVWVGASLALTATSAIGVVVGTRVLRSLPMHRMHRVSAPCSWPPGPWARPCGPEGRRHPPATQNLGSAEGRKSSDETPRHPPLSLLAH
jgi:hypothetical protein